MKEPQARINHKGQEHGHTIPNDDTTCKCPQCVRNFATTIARGNLHNSVGVHNAREFAIGCLEGFNNITSSGGRCNFLAVIARMSDAVK